MCIYRVQTVLNNNDSHSSLEFYKHCFNSKTFCSSLWSQSVFSRLHCPVLFRVLCEEADVSRTGNTKKASLEPVKFLLSYQLLGMQWTQPAGTCWELCSLAFHPNVPTSSFNKTTIVDETVTRRLQKESQSKVTTHLSFFCMHSTAVFNSKWIYTEMSIICKWQKVLRWIWSLQIRAK